MQAKHAEYQRISRRKRTRELQEFFGGKCNHCGITDLRVLRIDHIQGGGHKDKIYGGAGAGVLYNRIKLMKTNPIEMRRKFQLLCANCNWIKYLSEKE